MKPIADLPAGERAALIDWLGEQPGTVIAVAALRSGAGRVSVEGNIDTPAGLLVESTLLPGEPQGFGEGPAVVSLLEGHPDWTSVEVHPLLASEVADEFARRWGLARVVIDVIHTLSEPRSHFDHQLVRRLTAREALELPEASAGLLPSREMAAAAAEQGRVFAAVENGVLVGYGGSLAAGTKFADVAVHVASSHRGDGIAAACVASTCAALRSERLVPVWGTSSNNGPSLALARKLGFVEADRLHYLVRSR